MNFLYIRYRIAQNQHADYLKMHKKMAIEISRLKAVISQDLSKCEDEPENFIQRIALDISEAHLDKIQYQILDLLGDYKEDILEMRYYNTFDSDV